MFGHLDSLFRALVFLLTWAYIVQRRAELSPLGMFLYLIASSGILPDPFLFLPAAMLWCNVGLP